MLDAKACYYVGCIAVSDLYTILNRKKHDICNRWIPIKPRYEGFSGHGVSRFLGFSKPKSQWIPDHARRLFAGFANSSADGELGGQKTVSAQQIALA